MEARELKWKSYMICLNMGDDKLVLAEAISDINYELVEAPCLFDAKIGKILPYKYEIEEYGTELAFDRADGFRVLSFAFGRWLEERGRKFRLFNRRKSEHPGSDDNEEGLLDFLNWCETNAPEFIQMAERNAHIKRSLSDYDLPKNYNCFQNSIYAEYIFCFVFKDGGGIDFCAE
ncbi:hypothetical protein AGMMS49975_26350 [Clostridia bacterium]|nr:hypothetical protein AGMMS49975_26350 [Clostridia bacterium]